MKTKSLLILLLINIATYSQCWNKTSAGGYHCITIKNDGTILTWCWNFYGQLGDGTTVNKFVPIKLVLIPIG